MDLFTLDTERRKEIFEICRQKHSPIFTTRDESEIEINAVRYPVNPQPPSGAYFIIC